MYIYDNISLNSSYNEKYFRQICTENQKTNFMLNTYFPKIMPFMRQCGKEVTARQATDDNIIRRMRFACWITKATDTHSEYVIIIAFPRQLRISKRALVLRLCVVVSV
jgi:hypothetical protein